MRELIRTQLAALLQQLFVAGAALVASIALYLLFDISITDISKAKLQSLFILFADGLIEGYENYQIQSECI